jgi:hypothetical protein
MIREWVESLVTPCPPARRELGYLHELIAIAARHRRCRAAWADHLARSRTAVVAAVGRTPLRRTAIVLGSGPLLDLPLADLAAAFERVVLIDAVHPLAARWRARRYRNVELRTADVSGVIEALRVRRPGDALPTPRPCAALHQPDVDLIISLNLLSQLGVLPEEWLRRRGGAAAAAQAAAFGALVTQAHLDDLARCRATVCLISDIEWLRVDPAGRIVERGSSIFDVAPPEPAEEWLWSIAPAPEADPLISEQRRVIVACNPGKGNPGKGAQATG